MLKLVDVENSKSNQPVKAEAELIGERPAGEIPKNHPLVILGIDCYATQRLQAKLNIGSTDANEPLSRGLPAICVGLTSGGGSHTLGEYIETKPVSLGVGTLVDIIWAVDLKLSQPYTDVQRS